MKNIAISLFFFFSLISSINASADSIKCYSGNKLIYSRKASNISYTGELFVFQEDMSEQLVMTNAMCISKIDL